MKWHLPVLHHQKKKQSGHVKHTAMRKQEEKYLNAIYRIEELSIQLLEKPNDPVLQNQIAEAENFLCDLIKENEREVEILLGLYNEVEDIDDYDSYGSTEI